MIVGSGKIMRIIVENSPLITNHCGSTKFGKFRSSYISQESFMGLTAETLTIDFNETWRSVDRCFLLSPFVKIMLESLAVWSHEDSE